MGTERRAALLALAVVLAACASDPDEGLYDADGNPIGGAAARPAPPVLAEVDTVILREVFTYQPGPRDPFVSLLGTTVSGPELVDLELTGIFYNSADPARSVATLRERVSNRIHTVRRGQRLGRLYVAEVGVQDVWFTLDDFGVTRREMLTLRQQEDGIR